MAKIPEYTITKDVKYNIENPELEKILKAKELLQKQSKSGEIPCVIEKKKKRRK